jgi:protease YdgD
MRGNVGKRQETKMPQNRAPGRVREWSGTPGNAGAQDCGSGGPPFEPGRRYQSSAQMLAFVVLFGAAILAGVPVSAQELRPLIIGRDDRLRVDDKGPPWDAVGQVNIGGYRRADRCTGTLVAPNVVLTAAHCVMDPWSKKAHPLKDIHFLAGVQGAENKAHSTAKCLRFLPDFEYLPPEKVLPSHPAQKVRREAFRRDVVAVVLNERLAVEPVSLAEVLSPQPGLRLVHAGYPADRRYTLSAHFDCQFLRDDLIGGLWYTDCDTHPASSGGPLFIRSDEALKLVAVMVGGAERLYTIALPSFVWRELTRHGECP